MASAGSGNKFTESGNQFPLPTISRELPAPSVSRRLRSSKPSCRLLFHPRRPPTPRRSGGGEGGVRRPPSASPPRTDDGTVTATRRAPCGWRCGSCPADSALPPGRLPSSVATPQKRPSGIQSLSSLHPPPSRHEPFTCAHTPPTGCELAGKRSASRASPASPASWPVRRLHFPDLGAP